MAFDMMENENKILFFSIGKNVRIVDLTPFEASSHASQRGKAGAAPGQL